MPALGATHPDLVDEVHSLAFQAMLRDVLGRPEPTDADNQTMEARAIAWYDSPVTRERMLQINGLTLAYFQSRLPGSWSQAYLVERFGRDLTGHPELRPGHAPAGWTGLVTHLRRHGVSDEEMLAAGVAATASTGRLIDRFRDRVIFPVTHHGQILGFVGRRHPDLTDQDEGGPKYLNTADTPLFHKGAQLFGGHEEARAAGAVPVIVEGPMDAIAVTLASGGRHVGLAPLGTSLTHEQAGHLADLGATPVVATDADLAGQVAAERYFWILTPYGMDPLYAQLPTGSDPADLLATRGPAALVAALETVRPLGDVLLEERLTNLPIDFASRHGALVVAARPPTAWEAGVARISTRASTSTAQPLRDLGAAVTDWNKDPRKAAQRYLQSVSDVRSRLAAAQAQPAAQRWAALANELDSRLVAQGDWAALATLMQQAHDQGHDIPSASRRLLAQAPLGDLPAQDLRYRLVAHLAVEVADPSVTPAPASPAVHRERRQPASLATRPSPRRR